MAWIECNQEISRHPKTRRLVRYLEISVPQAIGHLICLWHYALDFAQDGNLSEFNDFDIAEAAMWTGDPNIFVSALIDSGYLDVPEDGGCLIHDWYDYAGKLIEKRKEDAERKRSGKRKPEKTEAIENLNNCSDGTPVELQQKSSGTPTELQQISEGTPVDVQRNSDVTVTVQYSNSTDNKRDRGRFTPPTLEEVKAYCIERNSNINPERFIDFYASKGWMVGKNKMKDWRAAIRTWEATERQKGDGNAGAFSNVPEQKKNFQERQYSADFLNAFETDLEELT